MLLMFMLIILEKKIEKEGSKKLIHTVTGMGYVLKDE